MKLLFLDTETTGLDPNRSGLIQVSGILDIFEKGEIKTKRRFDFECQPFKGDKLEKQALDLHGLTREKLLERPLPGLVYNDIIKLFDAEVDRYDKNDKFYLIGHNIKFDYDFMDAWFKKSGNKYWYAYVNYHLIDTVGLAMIFKMFHNLDIPNLKLTTLTEHFKIKHDAHNSKSDIEATRELFYMFGEKMNGVSLKKAETK